MSRLYLKSLSLIISSYTGAVIISIDLKPVHYKEKTTISNKHFLRSWDVFTWIRIMLLQVTHNGSYYK